jgi:hypothetical protein
MYIDILRHLRDAVRRKRPEKWRTNSWFLLHYNAPAHRSVLVMDFLAKNNLTTLEHPLYSPAVEFYLFPRLKSALKGRHFCDAKNIITNATEDLKRLSRWLPEVCSSIRGLFWRKCSVNDCTVLYFSERKWLLEHFEATTCIDNTDAVSFSFLTWSRHKFAANVNVIRMMGKVWHPLDKQMCKKHRVKRRLVKLRVSLKLILKPILKKDVYWNKL